MMETPNASAKILRRNLSIRSEPSRDHSSIFVCSKSSSVPSEMKEPEETISCQSHQELFLELCSELYNDLLDADLEEEVSECDLKKRQADLTERGALLVETAPELSNIVAYKLSALNKVMDHFRICRQSEKKISSTDRPDVYPLTELRKWVNETNEKLSSTEAKLDLFPLSRSQLEQMASDQQTLQIQIQNDGQILVRNAKNFVNGAESNGQQESRRQRNLKAIIRHWYCLWIRSLSLQCRIEREIERTYQVDDISESDPELCEPQIKRRRKNEDLRSETSHDDLLCFLEDTLLLTEENYKRVPNMNQIQVCQGCQSSIKNEDMEHQPDIGYSSGENSVNEMFSSSGSTAHQVAENESRVEEIRSVNREEEKLNIEASPGKNFYKTVPLDDAGVTDTETPRIPDFSMSTWYYKVNNDILTDSLIVNTEEGGNDALPTDDDIKEILSLIEDTNASRTRELIVKSNLSIRGTCWKEFICGRKNELKSEELEMMENKNPYESSSDDNENVLGVCHHTDLPNNVGSLKRRRKFRHFSHAQLYDSFHRNLLNGVNCYQKMAHSAINPYIISASSQSINQRKYKARRSPKFVFDDERLVDPSLAASFHSAPERSTLDVDSDSSTQEHSNSDNQSYEWDDYSACSAPSMPSNTYKYEKKDATSFFVQDKLEENSQNDIESLVAEIQLSLKIANSLVEIPLTKQLWENLSEIVSWNLRRFDLLLPDNSQIPVEKKAELHDLHNSWKSLEKFLETNRSLSETNCASSVSSISHDRLPINSSTANDTTALPYSYIVLSLTEKFASALRFARDHHNWIELNSAQSIEDVVKTIEICKANLEVLKNGHKELQVSIHSPGEHILEVLKQVAEKCEDTIPFVEKHLESFIYDNRGKWMKIQNDLMNKMNSIEEELIELRRGEDNSKQIRSELEFCQERMDMLETCCNHLKSVRDLSIQETQCDFASEFETCSTALTKLKSRFEEALKGMLTRGKGTLVRSSSLRKRSYPDMDTASTVIKTHSSTLKVNWGLKLFLLAATIITLMSWLLSRSCSFGNDWYGLHLNYVNGPPPM